jgi:valyl-tRNA synthetase
MREFQFGEAQREVHDFLWGEYCDWYLEMSKVRIRAGDETPVPVLAYVLERLLALLHPFMPFITEEIWSNLVAYLPGRGDRPPALVIAPYPVAEPALFDALAESDIDGVVEIVRAIRNLRAEFRIQPNQSIEATVDAPDIAEAIESEAEAITSLAKVELRATGGEARSDGQISLVLSRGTVTVQLGGVVDIGQEMTRLSKELDQIEGAQKRLSSRLADEDFLAKAPSAVIEKERDRLSGMEGRRARVEETLSRLGG